MILSLAAGVTHFIMPAFAALSVAADQASGRTRDWRLSALRPAQSLIASGLAALLPFGLLVAAVALVASVTLTGGLGLGYIAFYGAKFLARAGILVAVSALCRRTPTALTACYTVELLVLPAMQYALLLAPIPTGSLYPGGTLGGSVLGLALELLVMVAMVPLAIRSLARTGR